MFKVRNILASAALGVLTFGFGLSGLANAAENYTLFGEAAFINSGNNSSSAVQTTSDVDPGWGGLTFEVEPGTTLADLQVLSTDYFIAEGDCGGGAPRFQLETASGNMFIYIGPFPNYTNCTVDSWEESGDLLEDGRYIDTTQLGGAFYQPFEDALAEYGTIEITAVTLVTDAGWSIEGGVQTILFDNVVIGSAEYDFEADLSYPTTKDECKKGGWKNFTGITFKNQGDCVSFVTTKGRNLPAGSALLSNGRTF